jgi:hypothetical protein
MLKKLLVPVSIVVALLAVVPMARAHAARLSDYRPSYPNSDFYLYIPPYYGASCEEARSILERKRYRILKTIQCGGNYHKFKAHRRGFNYRIHVVTSRGKRMIDARSN